MALLSQRLPHSPAVAPHPRVGVRARAGRRSLLVAASKSAVQTGKDGVTKPAAEAGTRNPSTAASADDVGTPDSSGAGASVLASFDDARESTGSWVSDSILGRAWRAYNRSLQSNPVRTKAGKRRCPASVHHSRRSELTYMFIFYDGTTSDRSELISMQSMQRLSEHCKFCPVLVALADNLPCFHM